MSQDRFAHKKTEGDAHGAVIRYYTINLGLHTTEMNCFIKGSALNVVGNSVAKKKNNRNRGHWLGNNSCWRCHQQSST